MARKKNGGLWGGTLRSEWHGRDTNPLGYDETQMGPLLASKPHTRTDDGKDHIRVSSSQKRLMVNLETGQTVSDPMPTSKAARRKRNANLPETVRKSQKRRNKRLANGAARRKPKK